MKFKSGTRRRAIEYEKDLIKKWQKNKTFEKSVDNRPKSKSFVFYDGPPFLTGTPHHGHLLVSTIKDAVARYQTMQGHRVERVWGWDCHGLPAEVFVENQLGIKNKKEIGTKISIADYVQACRTAMVKTGTEWEDTIDRIGRWVEFKGAYKTMDNEYMESVWWAFKELYENGKIYEGEKILIYCTKDATPISKSEVAMENSYQVDTDPSVYAYFQIEDSDEYLLAWTTTPWTLPANVAIAVNSAIEYSLVQYGDKKFYIATDAIKKVLTDEKHQPLDYKVLKTVLGKDLIGLKYSPLFENRGPEAHIVLEADFVTAEDGTGIVHEAPAYGEEDYELCKKAGIPIVSIVDENGHYTEGRWLGKNIWEVNKEIAKTLVAEDKALKVEYIQHDYPHCHRCGTKLMYRAHPSWFMDIQAQKHEMLIATDKTRWVPKALQEGRFRNIIDSAPDWNLSRDRYWATPIPVWKGVRNDGTEVVKVFGSYKEFADFTGKKLDDYHLPMVMDVTFECDGVQMRHIGKVLDCWFESGSMPFAQFHYPFENKQQFEDGFPADFITEAIDQTRGWFYSLTAVNVALFGKSPYKNLICTGFVMASDGRKLSKKHKNYTDPVELMDKVSADAYRLTLMSSPLTSGDNFVLQDKDLNDVARKLSMVWNMYDFFTMYAEVDNFTFPYDTSSSDAFLIRGISNTAQSGTPDSSSRTENEKLFPVEVDIKKLNNPLDIWIISRVYQLIKEVGQSMSKYQLAVATRPILPFIDDVSNWYVRRSRRRFWKSGDDEDKNNAYRTLHYVLVQLSMILAPFTPFLAEELYQKLTGGESVHLLDWPKAGLVNEQVIDDMHSLRTYVNEGLSLRAQNQIKVRQPLDSVTIPSNGLVFEFDEILKDELNVKEVKKGKFSLDLNITTELKSEGLAREVIRQVQNARKVQDLKVDDRINLKLATKDKDLIQAINDFNKQIKQETLAVNLSTGFASKPSNLPVKIEKAELFIDISLA